MIIQNRVYGHFTNETNKQNHSFEKAIFQICQTYFHILSDITIFRLI